MVKKCACLLSSLFFSMCPILRAGSNFVDPEKPQHTLRHCKFLSLSQTIDRNLNQNQLDFQFDLPDQIQSSEAMRKRLSLALPRNSRNIPCYPLPPFRINNTRTFRVSLYLGKNDRVLLYNITSKPRSSGSPNQVSVDYSNLLVKRGGSVIVSWKVESRF